jgi:hypothetical protein
LIRLAFWWRCHGHIENGPFLYQQKGAPFTEVGAALFA